MDLNGQWAEYLPINLNRGLGITFYPHPIGDLDIDFRVKTDESTSECCKLS